MNDPKPKRICPSNFCKNKSHELDYIPHSNEYECAYCGDRFPAQRIEGKS